MSDYLSIHPENPQQRLIAKAAEIVRKGGVIVYPTDSVYAIGCHIGDKQALDRIRAIRRLDSNHNFTLMCRDLSELSSYAKVENSAFRAIKASTPGPFTFILNATSEVPRRLQHPKRKTVGLRVPNSPIAQALLQELGEPMMSVTLIMPGDEYPLTDPYDIRQIMEPHIDVFIDGGYCGLVPSTVVDMTGPAPEIIRQGMGDFSVYL
ncbi:MAG: L-threonylcarbamoyladenylate synthase [Porticoccaceae bacterium]|jgi:tRNA threonylcarbamoyl adenosine modification protein (Sua5/YciO/YrdC/YwlC family)|nr:L-threonylcarbamoyladenylate synthase [Porticoccaceae bacterium]MDP4655117.1 L-threonylcarbamoyladenylate synthase [Alphaproteobacteria bacterium]MDP4743505.1 L-threonylcarbamoyladenylate synthase [Porticoccaceae bacterium]MDP4752344.1 L-threonylcarbamoyladenylate synthase [Porticoccaceae bacterium]MDP4890525.1 L-threonylcarbamoyladenylate synthase [Porticoccaceae bacterium]|tara:strand:- start:10832 stop:11452 length:621 start_codon:yes stop_codon:yes gene_type:complete